MPGNIRPDSVLDDVTDVESLEENSSMTPSSEVTEIDSVEPVDIM